MLAIPDPFNLNLCLEEPVKLIEQSLRLSIA